MTKERVCANGPASPSDKHHSQHDAYHQAVYLHSLIRAAVRIIDGLDLPHAASDAGLQGLMTIIEERSCDLEHELDDPTAGSLVLGIDQFLRDFKRSTGKQRAIFVQTIPSIDPTNADLRRIAELLGTIHDEIEVSA